MTLQYKLNFITNYFYFRWKSGGAITLGYVPLDQPINKSAAVIPYPDYKTNIVPPKDGVKPGDGEHITSVFR